MDYVAPARNIGPIDYELHPYTPAISLSEAPEVIADLDAAVEEHKKAKKRQTDTKKSGLDQIAIKLLQLRAKNPYLPVARLFEKLGKLRFQAQISIREKLEEKGLAKFEEVRIGRSTMLLMDITNDGFKALELSIPTENKGRGSIAHRHFAHWIKYYFEQKGCKAYLEKVVPNTSHPVDVAVETEDGAKYFEVCITAFDNVLSHIQACLENTDIAVESLIFVVGTKTRLQKLKKLIQSNLIFSSYSDSFLRIRVICRIIENYMIKELRK